jgi:hypothetical protein
MGQDQKRLDAVGMGCVTNHWWVTLCDQNVLRHVLMY